eukprot:s1206_g7.t10
MQDERVCGSSCAMAKDFAKHFCNRLRCSKRWVQETWTASWAERDSSTAFSDSCRQATPFRSSLSICGRYQSRASPCAGDTFQIESFRLGPSRQDLEQLEQRLVAGAVETLETAASSSGRDVAPQRSIASAASVAAGGAAAQQAGNVSGAEGKAIRCYVAQAAPDAGAGDTFQIESFRRSPAAEELEMRLTDAPQIPYRDPNEGVLQSARNTVRR